MYCLLFVFRCVPDEQKSLALGIQWILVRCLGKYNDLGLDGVKGSCTMHFKNKENHPLLLFSVYTNFVDF